jgi:adenylate kinase family enzyme
MQASQLEPIVFADLFREALKTAGSLQEEIKRYMDAGEIIPTETIERMILWGLQHRPRFLLIGYPRSVEQFESLMKFCTTHAISVSKLWYFKIEDFSATLNSNSHFSKLHWDDEDIEQHKQNRLSEYIKFRDVMDRLLCTHEHLWKVVQLNNAEVGDTTAITSRISDSLQ